MPVADIAHDSEYRPSPAVRAPELVGLVENGQPRSGDETFFGRSLQVGEFAPQQKAVTGNDRPTSSGRSRVGVPVLSRARCRPRSSAPRPAHPCPGFLCWQGRVRKAWPREGARPCVCPVQSRSKNRDHLPRTHRCRHPPPARVGITASVRQPLTFMLRAELVARRVVQDLADLGRRRFAAGLSTSTKTLPATISPTLRGEHAVADSLSRRRVGRQREHHRERHGHS